MIVPPPLPPDYLSYFRTGVVNDSSFFEPYTPMRPPPLPSQANVLVNEQTSLPGSQITSEGGNLSEGRYLRATYNQGTPDLYDFQAHRYRTSKGESTYSRDDGILVIPVMGPDGTAPVTVKTHASIGFRVYTFEQVKDGTPPLLPAMADTPSGDVFLGSTISFPTPGQNMKNDLRFGQRGEYTYLQAEVRGSTSVFPIDRHPMPTMIDSLGLDRLLELDVQPGPQGLEQVSFLDERWQADGVDAMALTSYGIVK